MNRFLTSTMAMAWAAVLVLAVIVTQSAQAQTFTLLYNFCTKSNCTDGETPAGALIQGIDGNLYGATSDGGTNGAGTIFKIASGGTLTTLHSFVATDGALPFAGLIQATNGDFYGTTLQGGDYSNNRPTGYGTVFKITPGGRLTTLYRFDGTDGELPIGGLTQGTNGDLYGTTSGGNGAVFKITPKGELTTLLSWDGEDGSYPTAGLIQATDGDFYGTTYGGGYTYPTGCAEIGYGCGTIFKIKPNGTLTILYDFYGTDGATPFESGLVQGTDGNFYGTTYGGGSTFPTGCGGDGCGTVFKITPGGTLTTLYNFCSQSKCTDGAQPQATLVQGTDGDFYGTTSGGGNDDAGGNGGYGTVFKITASGTLTTLHYFDSWDGAWPAGLVQDTNGDFYGTTSVGGAYGGGTVFHLSVGLGPFVETQISSGKVGATVKILGTNLSGVQVVFFNGIPAALTQVSLSSITATVPSGATTGPVQVFLLNGTIGTLLTSNKNFTVIP